MTETTTTSPPEDPLPGGDPPGADRALRLLLGDAGAEAREDHPEHGRRAWPSRTRKCCKAAHGAARHDRRPAARACAARASRSRRSNCARACRWAWRSRCAAERGYEFLDRLVSIAIPRIRDFRGLNPRSFDGRGNYSLGVQASRSSSPRSTTTRSTRCAGWTSRSRPPPQTDAEAFALLMAFGMPFSAKWRPKGFDRGDRQSSCGADRRGRRTQCPTPRAPPSSQPS